MSLSAEATDSTSPLATIPIMAALFVTHDQRGSAGGVGPGCGDGGGPYRAARQPRGAFPPAGDRVRGRLRRPVQSPDADYSAHTVTGPGATLPVLSVPPGVADGVRVTAFVRSEHIQIGRFEEGDGVTGTLEATVVSSGFPGAVRRTIVQAADITRHCYHGTAARPTTCRATGCACASWVNPVSISESVEVVPSTPPRTAHAVAKSGEDRCGVRSRRLSSRVAGERRGQ